MLVHKYAQLLNLVMTMEQRRVVLQGTENNYLNINSLKKYLQTITVLQISC